MTWLERQWQHRGAGALLLLPVTALFAAVSSLRRLLYRYHVLPRSRLPVPVIVVGNIAVGGTGKTPLVLWLCEWLRACGYRPGIITRGYRGTARMPAAVPADGDAARFGDEAVLLAARSRCPVWVGRERAAAGRALLAAHPECNVLISDDGLQHYALERDMEIAIVDATRGHGNGLLLPSGPLREMPSRLNAVDAIVLHDESGALTAAGATPQFHMRLVGRDFHNLRDPARRAGPENFAQGPIHAVAGIGNPARFFRHLEGLGLQVSPHPFSDHHPYQPGDFSFAGAATVVMTEKDAVKCRRFATDDWWTLPVDAEVDPALGMLIARKLERR